MDTFFAASSDLFLGGLSFLSRFSVIPMIDYGLHGVALGFYSAELGRAPLVVLLQFMDILMTPLYVLINMTNSLVLFHCVVSSEYLHSGLNRIPTPAAFVHRPGINLVPGMVALQIQLLARCISFGLTENVMRSVPDLRNICLMVWSCWRHILILGAAAPTY